MSYTKKYKTTKTRDTNYSGNIIKLKSGRYMGKIMIGYKEDGKQNRISVYGSSLAEVSAKINELANKAYTKTYTRPTKLLLKQWLIDFIENYKKISWSDSTYISNKYQINSNIIPNIGDIPLNELDTMTCQIFINKLYENGNRLSPESVHKIACILRSALEKAKLLGYISVNPFIGIDLPKIVSQEVEVLTDEEQSLLISACKGSRMYYMVVMLLQTGLRESEMLALDWNDIDFDSKHVTVNKSVCVASRTSGKGAQSNKTNAKNDNLIKKGQVKTYSSLRRVPLTKLCIDMLMEWKSKGSGVGLVFPSTKDTVIWPRNFQRDFAKYVAKSGITTHCSPHTLRHTFATNCFSRSIHVAIVSRWLGHASTDVTYKKYVKICYNLELQSIEYYQTSPSELINAINQN